jgi:hypothetical protein
VLEGPDGLRLSVLTAVASFRAIRCAMGGNAQNVGAVSAIALAYLVSSDLTAGHPHHSRGFAQGGISLAEISKGFSRRLPLRQFPQILPIGTRALSRHVPPVGAPDEQEALRESDPASRAFGQGSASR